MIESSAKSISYTKEAADAFSAESLNKQDCQTWFISIAFPNGIYCPKCKIKITVTNTLNNFWNFKRCVCESCNHWFTAKSGTILQDSKLSAREFYLLSLLLGFGIEIKEISRILKIHPVTVRLWQKKIEIMGKHEILG